AAICCGASIRLRSGFRGAPRGSSFQTMSGCAEMYHRDHQEAAVSSEARHRSKRNHRCKMTPQNSPVRITFPTGPGSTDWPLSTLPALCAQAAQHYGAQTYIEDGDTRLSYVEFDALRR